MFQPAQALQPHFDPPLPPFRTSCLESWFEEFEAALELNGIWLQEFMFEVLEYHLPRDLKRRLTYLSWSPRPYDHLRDAVLQSYGIKHGPFSQEQHRGAWVIFIYLHASCTTASPDHCPAGNNRLHS
uniref:Uncharacterized protein n=1 Tax=Rhipicephalus zambeziensis TaxID=60191 RepID=A0A224YIZ0_9ACAR